MNIQDLTLLAMAYRHDMPQPDANGNVTVAAEFVDKMTLFFVKQAANAEKTAAANKDGGPEETRTTLSNSLS